MFDLMKAGYELRCPTGDTPVSVPLSHFRTIKRLPATTTPVVFQVQYSCPTCGERHDGLITHESLDWQPISADVPDTFVNVMTGQRELVGTEMQRLAGDFIQQGNWPWQFFCYPESALRPAFPSSVKVLAPATTMAADRQGVMFRCASCHRHSVNLVTRDHLDVPFHNDDRIAFIRQLFDGEDMSAEERFRERLEMSLPSARWTDGNVA